MKLQPNQAITKNRKAWFDYEILQQYVAGIQLMGSEVKSIRNNGMSIDGAWVKIQNNEVFLIGADIPPYKYSQQELSGHQPKRDRKLLLHRKEIREIQIATEHQKLTVIPLEIFLSERGIFKSRIALAKGKKNKDKRNALKEKAFKRESRNEKV